MVLKENTGKKEAGKFKTKNKQRKTVLWKGFTKARKGKQIGGENRGEND